MSTSVVHSDAQVVLSGLHQPPTPSLAPPAAKGRQVVPQRAPRSQDAVYDVDGALALSLVESAVASMAELEQRNSLIASRARDLIQVTRTEREQFTTALKRAQDEAELWKQQALAAEASLRAATLRAWEADLQRRENELLIENASQRAAIAEERVHALEFYIKKIGTFLKARLPMIGH